MKRNYYLCLVLVVCALVFSGCGKKEAANNNQPAANDNGVVQNEDSGDGEEEITASSLALLGRGKALHCTFSFEDKESKQSGDFYVDGKNKKFRTEAEITAVGEGMKNMQVKTISDGAYVYTWNSLNDKAGFKMKITEEKSDSEPGQTQDLNQEIKFRCRSWKVDNSMFELPSGVQFTDMDAMIKQVSTPAASGGIDLCAICSQIPDASQKSECQKTNCK